MSHIYIIHLCNSRICVRTLVVFALCSDCSPTLGNAHISRIHLSVGFEMCSQGDARRNVYVGWHGSESSEKSDVVCSASQSHLRFHSLDVGGIDGIALCIQLEGSGQTDVECTDSGMIHISVERESHRNRMIGIAHDKLLRHITRKAHDILLAYLCKESQIYLSGILHVEGVEIHITLHFHIGVGSGESHSRQTHLGGIERNSARQTAQYNSAFLLHAALHNLQSGIGSAIEYGINRKPYVTKSQVIIIQSLKLRLEYVIIIQLTLDKAQTLH